MFDSTTLPPFHPKINHFPSVTVAIPADGVQSEMVELERPLSSRYVLALNFCTNADRVLICSLSAPFDW